LGVDESLIQADPIRIIEAVVTGISFLGAGTILHHRGENKIEGLTTAASLLFVGALGISVALSQFILAVTATIITLITLRVLLLTERKI
jgi:putative Mg2+ transporter-C (MgtC) family protein